MADFESVYYSKGGYWRGEQAIKKLAAATGKSRDEAEKWLLKQDIYQIYLPAPKHVPRGRITETVPNNVHQTDILYLPEDRVNRRTYKYCLCIVDVASRFKEAEPLPDKTANATKAAIQKIYKRGPLKWPNLIQVDAGKEFLGVFKKLMEAHKVQIRVAIPGNHRQQGIVERFNRTLAERLFVHQYHGEIKDPSARVKTWVKFLPEVVKDLNGQITRLTGLAPVDAIKLENVHAKPSKYEPRDEQLLDPGDTVRYLYLDGELEGGTRRATDPIWSLTKHNIASVIHPSSSNPALYKLGPALGPEGSTPSRSFVREELLIV